MVNTANNSEFRELTSEEIELVAGGQNPSGSWGGSYGGAAMGGMVGANAASSVAARFTNNRRVIAGAAIAGAAVGGAAGAHAS